MAQAQAPPAAPRRRIQRPHESSVPDMPGYKAEGELARTLRREVSELLGRSQLGFPGAQPVSFCRRHIDELKRADYFLCEKSDGIRCLMYFTRDGDKEIHYLIDRKNEYYYVPELHFPMPGDDTFHTFHTETIIDGELVLDTVAPGKKVLKYLVFDSLLIDNKSVMERTLDKRLAYFSEYVYNPYRKLCKAFPAEVKFFPFQLEFKRMEFSYAIEMVFRKILPKLPHGNDGLIFTCRTSPYTFGTDSKILKWKPSHENSVDFRLNLDLPVIRLHQNSNSNPNSDEDPEPDTESEVVDYESKPTFNLSVYYGDSKYCKFGEMYVTDDEWENLKSLGQPLDEEIVECRMDEQKRWKFMRFRKDKKDANHISTVLSVIESIQDAVEEDELIRSWREIRDAWKQRNAPPPPQNGSR